MRRTIPCVLGKIKDRFYFRLRYKPVYTAPGSVMKISLKLLSVRRSNTAHEVFAEVLQ